jgi:hypothetical protein
MVPPLDSSGKVGVVCLVRLRSITILLLSWDEDSSILWEKKARTSEDRADRLHSNGRASTPIGIAWIHRYPRLDKMKTQWFCGGGEYKAESS